MSNMRELVFRKVTYFLKNEQGGCTIFDLMWFALLVGICGLTFNILDEYRIDSVLQPTVDRSEIAVARNLPTDTLESSGTKMWDTVTPINMRTGHDGEIATMSGALQYDWVHPRSNVRLPVAIN